MRQCDRIIRRWFQVMAHAIEPNFVCHFGQWNIWVNELMDLTVEDSEELGLLILGLEYLAGFRDGFGLNLRPNLKSSHF